MTNDQEIGYITIRSDYNLIKIPFETIMYIASGKGFVTIHTPREKVISNTPLRLILYQLPQRLFIQTHMNYVTAISQIEAIEPSRITLMNNDKVPLSKGFRQSVIDEMMRLGIIENGF